MYMYQSLWLCVCYWNEANGITMATTYGITLKEIVFHSHTHTEVKTLEPVLQLRTPDTSWVLGELINSHQATRL